MDQSNSRINTTHFKIDLFKKYTKQNKFESTFSVQAER